LFGSEVAVENAMYSNKFVISVLVDGKVVKEHQTPVGTEAHIPFGSCYTLRLRNKNSRQAACKLFIDGEKMCKGGIIVPANSYRDIDCSTVTLQKFKFVDLQSVDAQEHGKDQSNVTKQMGLIVAQWHLEVERPRPPKVEHHHHHHHYPVRRREKIWTFGTPGWIESPDPGLPSPNFRPMCYYDDGHSAKKAMCESASPTNWGPAAAAASYSCSAIPMLDSVVPTAHEGATVEGGLSNQRFGEMHLELETGYTELKLLLKGYEVVPLEAVAPVGGAYCDGCGAKALRSSSRFCHACGLKL
jgi:hypothetical protein